MPALSSSNRSQLSYLLEGTYPTNYGVPQAGPGVLLNMLSESLNYDVKTQSSKTIRSDRQVPDLTQVSASANGGFAFEQIYRENDPFIEGVLQNPFTVYGTLGVSAAIPTLTFAAGTITAGAPTAGVDIFTSLKKGQWFTVRPPAGASAAVKAYFAGRPFRVSTSVAPTTTVITLDASTQINTTLSGASISNGFIASSRAANGNIMKSYTLEVQHADIGQYRQYVGMIPSKMDLKLQVGEIVTGSFEFMGKSMNLLGASAMGVATPSQTFTPANATKGVFDMFEGGSSISATTFIKSADISMDNTLRGQEAVGVFGFAGIGVGTMVVTGKLSVYFADATMYNKFISGAGSSLSIPILDVDGNGYTLYFPRIKYTAAKVATGGLDQDNMLDMDFQALPDTTAGSDTLGQTVVIYRHGA